MYRLVDKPCCHRRTVTADASDKAKIGIIIPKLYSRMSRLVYFCILLIWSFFRRAEGKECNPMGIHVDAAGTFAVSRKRRRPSPTSSLIGQLSLVTVTAVPL